MYCNKDCQCREDLPFTPVYAKHARLVYFSPCHAGCSAVSYSGHDKVLRFYSIEMFNMFFIERHIHATVGPISQTAPRVTTLNVDFVTLLTIDQ